VRETTLCKRLMDLPGVNVTEVKFLADKVVVTVTLSRNKLIGPECGYTTRARYDTRGGLLHLAPSRPRLLAPGGPGPTAPDRRPDP
jgi:hypothetical protein